MDEISDIDCDKIQKALKLVESRKETNRKQYLKRKSERQSNIIDQAGKIAEERNGECLSEDFINSRYRLRWKCHEDHEWDAQYHHVSNGSWCPICNIIKLKQRGPKNSIEDAQNLAFNKEGEYLSGKYKKCTEKLPGKDIPGHEGKYAATKEGKIYSYHKNDYLKPYLPPKYYQVSLTKNKVSTTYKVHILIAKTYIPNHDNLPIVNHIDGDTHNNSVSNLEWVSYSRSILHAHETGLNKHYTRKVCKMDDNGDVIKVFDSVKEAADSINSPSSIISLACKGKNFKAKGYYWKYEDDKNWKIPINKNFKRIQRTDVKTGDVTEFETSKEAAASCGCALTSIRKACNGVTDVLRGYRWKYLPRKEPEPDSLFIESRSWKQVKDFPLYRISPDGRLYSDWNKQLRSLSDNDGYKRIELCYQGKKRNTSIHQLIAQHYYENPLSKKKVNHKNGERGDNRLENLEWNTQCENVQHAHDTGLNKGSKPVIQYDKNGNEVARYKSAAEASNQTNTSSGMISNVCLKKSTIAGGYIWRFENDPLTSPPGKIYYRKRRVIRVDKNGGETVFNSLTEAAKDCGGNSGSNISRVCNEEHKKAYGYKWNYED